MMKKNKKFLLVTVDMGYGHQRTAYPLKKFALEERIINANNYEGIPKNDKRIWQSTRNFYEFISDFKKVPLIGSGFFALFNKFQQIPIFYPKRDLSKPTFYLKNIYRTIKAGWGRDLIEKLKLIIKKEKKKIPLITTFFIPAFMAEVFNYPGDIFCVICDADIARIWTSINPSRSRIKYFASNSWTRDRLRLYGVKKENIFLTGYPLPDENIGGKKMKILKDDLKKRIINLDPKKEYRRVYGNLLKRELGILPKKTGRPLTILFSIGGAGVQKEIVFEFLKSLKEKVKNRKIKMILSAGIKEKIRDYFLAKLKKIGLLDYLGKEIEIIFEKNINDYFSKFNQKIRETDILWTKPSELSFYSGLGLPILIAPSVGSQEDFNRKWLLRIGSGIVSENPKYARQWLFDYLESGRFAEAAMEGFIEIEKLGIYKIKEII